MDIKQWLTETARRPIYDQDIAQILGVTRKTANKRINAGLDASDLITVCRGLNINPVIALTELNYVTYDEVTDYLDSDGELVSTASAGTLALQLARLLNPATRAEEIDELTARRQAKKSNTTTPTVQTTTYDPNLHVAYHGDDEDTLRRQQGGHLDDDDYIP